MEFAALSLSYWADWNHLPFDITHDVSLQQQLQKIQHQPLKYPNYKIVNGKIFFKGRLMIPPTSSCIPRLLEEFHSISQGGHSGAMHTYKQIAANLHWQGMMKRVKDYVADCLTCQRNKYETMSQKVSCSHFQFPTKFGKRSPWTSLPGCLNLKEWFVF